jgi:hypothetical protein
VDDLSLYLNEIHFTADDIDDEFVRKHIAEKLMLTIYLINRMLSNFRQNPRPTIVQVADKMRMSLAALFRCIEFCGIDDPEDLKNPSMHVADFLRSNRIHSRLIEMVIQSEGDYHAFRDLLETADEKKVLVNWE